MKYAILIKPIGNIPFFETMKKMCLYEARIMFEAIDMEIVSMEVKKYGKGTYLTFITDQTLSSDRLEHITKLSFYYTLFKIEAESWCPIDDPYTPFIGEDLSVRLKYNGKTNESFTRLMINVAKYSSGFANVIGESSSNLTLLDPVCGKGTTLFEGLIDGYQAYGVERNKQSVNDMNHYVLRYLKEGRYKHAGMTGKAIINGKQIGEYVQIDIGKTKDEVKKKTGQMLKVLRGDTTDTALFYKKNSVNFIVADLPYGVQHIGKNQETSVRKLDDLLTQSIASWIQVLKKGGVIALSWNTYTDKRDRISDVLQAHGLDVKDSDEYLHFAHRVSQAINRDIIVAVKQ